MNFSSIYCYCYYYDYDYNYLMKLLKCSFLQIERDHSAIRYKFDSVFLFFCLFIVAHIGNMCRNNKTNHQQQQNCWEKKKTEKKTITTTYTLHMHIVYARVIQIQRLSLERSYVSTLSFSSFLFGFNFFFLSRRISSRRKI